MSPIARAISQLGSVTKLAATLSVSPQAVCFWRDGRRKVPAGKCPEIERATGGAVRCEDLRPDVAWEVLRQQAASTSAYEGPARVKPQYQAELDAMSEAAEVRRRSELDAPSQVTPEASHA